MDAEAAKGRLLARCTSGGGAIDWGKRLRVERAPEPANILWENFGHPAWTVIVRRVISALASFVLIICTVAAFVAAEGYRGSAPSTCDIAVCDDRLEFALLNQNVSFSRAVICAVKSPLTHFQSVHAFSLKMLSSWSFRLFLNVF